jgi:hypothetical protein
MRGNSHVRFGAGDEETCLGNGVRRFIPTLPKTGAALFLLWGGSRTAFPGEGRRLNSPRLYSRRAGSAPAKPA